MNMLSAEFFIQHAKRLFSVTTFCWDPSLTNIVPYLDTNISLYYIAEAIFDNLWKILYNYLLLRYWI